MNKKPANPLPVYGISRIALPMLLSIGSSAILMPHASADVGIFGAVEYVENPRGVQSEKDLEDLKTILAVDGNLNRDTTRLLTSLNYRASKVEFKDDVLRDRTAIEGRGLLSWRMIPDTLTWDLSNSRTDQLIESTISDTRENRQIVNVLSTGPTLTLPLGGLTLLRSSVEYSSTKFERTRVDRDASSFDLALQRRVTGSITGNLNLRYSETKYDNDFAAFDYDLNSISLGLNYFVERISLGFEIGEYRLDQKGFGEETNPLFNADAAYRFIDRGEIFLTYNKSLQDFTGELRYLLNDQSFDFTDDVPVGPITGDSYRPNVFRTERSSAGIRFNTVSESQFLLSYSVVNRDSSNEASNLADDDELIVASYSRSFSNGMTLGLRAAHNLFERPRDSAELERNRYGFYLGYSMLERLRLRLYYWYVDQDSFTSELNFDGSNTGLSVSYRF